LGKCDNLGTFTQKALYLDYYKTKKKKKVLQFGVMNLYDIVPTPNCYNFLKLFGIVAKCNNIMFIPNGPEKIIQNLTKNYQIKILKNEKKMFVKFDKKKRLFNDISFKHVITLF